MHEIQKMIELYLITSNHQLLILCIVISSIAFKAVQLSTAIIEGMESVQVICNTIDAFGVFLFKAQIKIGKQG